MLTAERLRSILDYDPDTGIFRWRWDPAKKPNINSRDTKREVAGSVGRRRYRSIKTEQKLYYAGRLAWLYVHGRWPIDEIDHIDGNKTNDRIANLREASRYENQYNVGVTARNRSGHKGVHWVPRYQKWQVEIRVNGQRLYLGRFDCPEAAAAAYAKAAQNYHGEFARVE
jgi:HNH endonuclease/AP2 domain-containing protein